MFALRATQEHQLMTGNLKSVSLPQKLRPKTYDEIRAKVLEDQRTVPLPPLKGKKPK